MPWGQESVYVKRVIAVEGDVIQVISRHGVLINGQPLNEPYIVSPPRYDWGPHSVPDAHVVVLGDNRNDSFDSHHWGFLPVERIVGRPTLRLWPPSRWTFF